MSQRILFTVEHLHPMGPARSLLPLAQCLSQAGFDIVVVVLGQATFEPQVWIDSRIRVFFANGDDQTPLHTSRDALYVIRELRILYQLIEPDVVHAWCGESIWLTLLSVQQPPLLHRLPSFRLMATELQLPTKHSFLRQWLQSRFSQQLETLIVPHLAVSQRMRALGCDAHEIQTISNGVVTSEFVPELSIAVQDRGSQVRKTMREQTRQRLAIPESSYLAVAIADLVPRNRLKDLIWATDLLACVRDDFHFAIIGKGSQQRRLQRFAAQTEARPHVHFLGYPDAADSILASADAYWHSHLQSPLPVNLISAMGMGIPVISVFGPGTEELIRHQETGFATNFGARDEFARWTKFLIEQTEPAALLARQGQAFVEREFPMEQVVQRYMETFQSPVSA